MKRNTAAALILFLAAVMIGGCGKSEEQKKLDTAVEQAKNAAESMKSVAQSMQDMANQTPVPPVSYKVLYDFLPKTAEGLPCGKPNGETTSMGEHSWSQATARYEVDGKDQRVEVRISDFAHIGMLYAPLQFFYQQNYSHEDDNGYERVVKIADCPSMERWEIESKHSNIGMLVGERFYVEVDTYNIGEGSARTVAESVDIKKLAVQKAN